MLDLQCNRLTAACKYKVATTPVTTLASSLHHALNIDVCTALPLKPCETPCLGSKTSSWDHPGSIIQSPEFALSCTAKRILGWGFRELNSSSLSYHWTKSPHALCHIAFWTKKKQTGKEGRQRTRFCFHHCPISVPGTLIQILGPIWTCAQSKSCSSQQKSLVQ